MNLENIMYVAHIYGGAELDCRSLSTAILNNVPTFISEWSNSDGSANVNDEMDMKTHRFIALMDRYNVSSTFFIVHQSDSSRTFFIKQGCWDKTWDDSTLDSCGIFYKKFVMGNYINYQYEISDYTMVGVSIDNNMYFWNEEYRNNITQIITKNTLDLPNNVVRAWDISNGSGNIVCYIVANEDETYTAYIASSGDKIYIKETNWRLFKQFKIVTLIDLSYLSTDNLITMMDWFTGNNKLREIKGLQNLDTSKVTNVTNMFLNCSELEEVNLTSFDFSKITDYKSMFSGIKTGANVYVKDIENARIINEIKGNYVTINIYYGSEGNWTEYLE